MKAYSAVTVNKTKSTEYRYTLYVDETNQEVVEVSLAKGEPGKPGYYDLLILDHIEPGFEVVLDLAFQALQENALDELNQLRSDYPQILEKLEAKDSSTPEEKASQAGEV